MKPFLSIVVPAYNEEASVPRLYAAVHTVLAGLMDFEIIFVDDGSTDRTAAAVHTLRAGGAPVRLIRFGRNFGQQAALLAGIEAAHGQAVITMDCDLQHPPEFLPQMVQAWLDGAKIVQMVRRNTAGVSPFKRLSSKLFYRLVNTLSEMPVTCGAADYQLLDQAVVQAVLQFRDRQPFLRGLVSWLGFPTTRIEYCAAARNDGRSGYSLRKMLSLSVHALTALSSKPLRFSFYLGLVTAMLSLTYAAYALVALIAGQTVPGWASVVVAVSFLGAVQLVSIGIVGEYIARIYEQSRGVPRFVIVESDDEALSPGDRRLPVSETHG